MSSPLKNAFHTKLVQETDSNHLPSNDNKVSKSRIAYIDEMRGFAAITVIIGHYSSLYYPHILSNFFDLGVFAVAVFFCISGRIIPHSVRDNSFDSTKRFFLSRFFRLFPAYWVSIIFGIFVMHPSMHQIIVNLTMIQRYLGSSDIFGAYWTLQVEVVFYTSIILFCITGIFYKSKTFPFFAVFWALASVAMGLARYYLNIKTPIAVTVGMTIMCGMATYYFYKGVGSIDRKTAMTAGIVSVLLLAVSFFFGYSKDWGFSETPYRFLISDGLAFLFFVYYAKWQPNIRLLAFIGSISYPLYLVHQGTLELMAEHIPQTPYLVQAILAAALAIFMAWIIHLYVEKPGIALGRKVIRRYTKFPA